MSDFQQGDLAYGFVLLVAAVADLLGWWGVHEVWTPPPRRWFKM